MAGRHRLKKQPNYLRRSLLSGLAVMASAVALAWSLQPEPESPTAPVATAVGAWEARVATTKAPTPTTTPVPLCDDFGGTAPHVAAAGHRLADRFDDARVTAAPGGLDVWIDDVDRGWEIARYAVRNLTNIDGLYVIYRSSVNLGGHWLNMQDRGDATANHEDHVHISFRSASDTTTECDQE